LVLGSVAAPRARAQTTEGFRIDRFRPPPSAEDGLGVQYARTLGHLVPSVGLVLDYAHAPLVARTSDGQTGAIAGHRFLAHVTGALGVLDFLEFHVRMPVAFTGGDGPFRLGGASFASADVVGLGDGALGGSVAIFSQGREGLSLGAMIEAMLPWGTSTSYASDAGAFSGRGQLLLTFASPHVSASVMAGAFYRPDRALTVGTGTIARTGSEFEYALSIVVPTIPALDLLLEVVGAVSLPDGQPHPAPLEAMFGARGRLGAGVSLEGGIAGGFSMAPGVPDVRAVLGVRWTLPPPPIGDTDGDGFLDTNDECPDQAEDRDAWQDGDGCLDPDNDGDGWMDTDDACPIEAEDRDGFGDTDGCPDPDNDQDGVPDEHDRCPLAPGATFQHGCPQNITIDGEHVRLAWPIEFAEGSAEIPVNAGAMLDEIAGAFTIDPNRSHWEIAVRIVPRGRRDDGVATATARAQAIVAALVARGVDASRLTAATLPPEPGDPIEITFTGAPDRPITTARPVAPEAPPPVAP
jgi:hypothetical protein